MLAARAVSGLPLLVPSSQVPHIRACMINQFWLQASDGAHITSMSGMQCMVSKNTAECKASSALRSMEGY